MTFKWIKRPTCAKLSHNRYDYMNIMFYSVKDTQIIFTPDDHLEEHIYTILKIDQGLIFNSAVKENFL